MDILEIWSLKNNGRDVLSFYDDVVLDSRIDRDSLKAEIIRKCGALTPIYNTSSSFEYFTKAFFVREKGVISRMLDTVDYDYNPLENFERNEELKHNASEVTVTDETTTSEVQRNSETENKASAYNESLYQPDTQSIDSANSKNTDVRDYGRERDFESSDINRAHGINGLTTKQDLLKKEREVAKFNVVKWIVEKYMCEYFYLVY